MGALKNRLYCTFVPVEQITEATKDLQVIADGKLFILDIAKENEVAITYNTLEELPESRLKATVLCHRHKPTKTLYTINALNTIALMETGKSCKDYKVDWNKYQSSLLVVQNRQLVIFKTKIINIL